MRLVTRRIPYVPGQTFTLWPIGDIHLGSANCDTTLLDHTLWAIQNDPNALWVAMGDMMEAIAPNDKRWTAGGIDENIVNLASQDRIGDVYVDKVAEKLRPIADKLCAYLDGNHERTFNAHYYTNLSVRILDAIGRPDAYAATGCYARLLFEDPNGHRNSVRIMMSHGYQAGRKDGAKMNGLDDLMGCHEGCHIYLVGHSHSRLIKTKTRLGTNDKFTDLRQYVAYGAHCGSFMRTYQKDTSGYAESALYPPSSLGPIRFTIAPDSHDSAAIEAIQ